MKYLLTSLLLLLLGLIGALKPLKSAMQWMVSPIQLGLGESAFNLKDSVLFFTRVAKVNTQNKFLLEEIVSLKLEIVALQKVREENAFLRDQLELHEQGLPEEELVLARVMGNPQDLTGATVILNRGAMHGISAEDVVVSGGYLVGKVRETTNMRSLVDLITSPNMSITAFDIDASFATEGVVIGKHGTSMEMVRILPGEPVEVGDVIVTSGKDGIFLPGFIVGEVVEVIEVPTEPLKSAQVESVLDLDNLREVLVILKK